MAKQIVWSFRAQSDRKNILQYWRERNNSSTYSKKLNKLFIQAIRRISEFPQIGKITNYPAVRVKVVKEYLIVYEESDTHLAILSIWDTRQDPEKLDKVLAQ